MDLLVIRLIGQLSFFNNFYSISFDKKLYTINNLLYVSKMKIFEKITRIRGV
jgi:hypothetical protein